MQSVYSELVSREGKTFNTTNLVYHLKTKHHKQFIAYKKRDDAAKETSKGKSSATKVSKQLSFEEATEKTCKWDI